MRKEWEFVLQVLADFLNKRPTTSQIHNLNLVEIRRICQSQQIEGILYYQIKNIYQDEVVWKKEIEKTFASDVYYYTQRKESLRTIKERFEAEGIPFFVFKGIEIAKLYSFPQLRTMGDIDLLVHQKDKQRAGAVLESLGMKNQKCGPYEWVYYQNNVEYELHSELMSEGETNPINCRKFMSQSWQYANAEQGTMAYKLDWSYHFVFILLHLRKHLINNGVGIRQFMDLVVIAQKCDLDWEWIRQQLGQFDMLPFVMNCFALCQRWFDVAMPMTVQLDDSFFENATETVFNGGLFGFCEKENENNYTKLLIKKDKKARVKIFFSIVFPSYKVMKEKKEYQFLDGKPFLLPFVWGYRFFHCIVNGKAKSGFAAAIQPLRISNKDVTLRDEKLKQWGI